MTAPGPAPQPQLTPSDVLEHVSTGVLVTDRDCALLYANSFAVTLFGFPDEAEHLTGRPLLSLGVEQSDAVTVQHMADNVLRGWPWEGTFASQRADGTRVFVRAHAAPLRSRLGDITGIVIMAREATRRGGQRASDRIGLLHGDTLLRRAELHARGWIPEPGTWAKVGEPVRYPRGHFCELAMSRHDTIVVADLKEGDYPAPSAKSLRAGQGVGLTSVLAAPLIARGQLLGVMSLGLSLLTDREERHYGADDRDFFSAIASRVAIAIDNSLLFEEERRTALAFQTSLLPKSPPFVDGLEVAYKYVPARPLETHGQGIQTQVGGDWYDIIPLSAGRVGIVIGDVEGRGARAAAVMGQLRAALRAFAQDDKSPAEILRRLDDWVRALGSAAADGAGLAESDPPTVSCTYLVYDAWARTLSFSNAGHVPPLIVRGHDVSPLEIRDRGVLLGVRGKGVPGLPTYREEMRYLAPGSTLIFYTDGLVDRRPRADGQGHYTDAEVMEMLRRAVRIAADGTVEQIAVAAEHAVPGEIDDDMAVVVVRTSQLDLASWEGQFPAEPIRVSEARRLAHETFLGWGMESEQADLTCLLVSEVVTNVVLHAAASPTPRHELVLEGAGPGPLGILGDWELSPFDEGFGTPPGKDFTLRLRRGHEAIWVEVLDSDLRLPRIRSAGESDEGGRGLYLVDQLASRWGSRPTKDGKAVWFEMPIKGGIATGQL